MAVSGVNVLRDPLLNQGLGFTRDQRDKTGTRGLLPPAVRNVEQQVQWALTNLHRKTSDLEKYIFLTDLQDLNEHLFYEVAVRDIKLTLPLIYTPTVGTACQRYSEIMRRPRGMFISIEDRGNIARMFQNWPASDVRAIVVTDGERILGLGDQGVGGMGIPVGKLSLYTACGGVAPALTLPVTLDVGTNRKTLIDDPLYMGLKRERVRDKEYDAFVDEFVQAAIARYPNVLIQFEDFANINCFRLLDYYKEKICCFNDDIQGTGAVTLAGLLAAVRFLKQKLSDQRILFFGAGAAAVGIAKQIMGSMMMTDGVSLEYARSRIWFVDSQGLVVKSRKRLAYYKQEFAHDHPQQTSLLGAVKSVKPTALIGVSGMGKTFTKEIVEEMSRLNARPIVFALSNPTPQSECTNEEAVQWSNGAVLYASGSPMAPTQHAGKLHVTGQCNNVYIFPGVGMGIIAAASRRVTDEMFLEAARVLSELVTQDELDSGCIFPALPRVREASERIAVAVAKMAFDASLARVPVVSDIAGFVRKQMYQPSKYLQPAAAL
eukprot:TRINITY_DN7384_c0_g1_i1.p1 TRINITY_DN7384_c0_g1~~TRINITY_DN7384_c0_g1_i1.p1  ORF type:complete len:546 (-),score=152.52 TRINITY_DN7384_c0_g1_i1:389-2026(-)